MPRPKPQWEWEGLGFSKFTPEAKAVKKLQREIITILTSRIPLERHAEVKCDSKMLFCALERACRNYLLFREESKTRPSPAEVLAGLQEADKSILKNGRIPPNLDEETTEVIMNGVGEEFLNLTADQCLDAFVENKELRARVIAASSDPKGGAPKNSTRVDFAVEVAAALQQSGISPTKASNHKYDNDRTSRDKGGTPQPACATEIEIFVTLGSLVSPFSLNFKV